MDFLRARGLRYKAIDEVDLGASSDEVYLRANVKAPRMAGALVKVFVWFLELPIFGRILIYFLKRQNLIHKLVSFAELQESPLYVPMHPYDDAVEKEVKCVKSNLSPPEQVKQAMDCLQSSQNMKHIPDLSFRHWTIADYSRAYLSGELTPRMVADRLINAVRESSSSELQMGFYINFDAEDILRQAVKSTIRYERGEPLSVLDGVPIAIKDEIDCLPYPTTGGTTWMHKVRPCKDDACCVKRLRLCGAILMGKTNMHELGAGTSGINPHYGSTRNPHDPQRVAGGSSSGSAAVVAAGLCPAALGVDGGGSVRMPAALCGVVGFKPSFGCVSHSGVLPLNWTVGMVGILAGTVEDALVVYAAICEASVSDQSTAKPPKLCFPLLKSPVLISDITLAKYGEWFNDCTEEIRVCCTQALAKLQKKYSWKIIEVTVPEIEVIRLAHYVTIGSECSTSIACLLDKINREELGWDARVALPVYGSFSSREYLNAQRIRNRQLQFHKRIFSQADVIVTPTTGVTAYEIKNDVLQTGELDYVNGAALVRFQIAGNFLGLPAVTVPVGYDKSGLPIGLQFIGKPWGDSMLIHIAYAMQEVCISEYKKPEVYYDILSG
ncbi:PREDICTED: fatty acid amide hydrolase-like isoform X2 [Ipomoea nil]|uniref:fatty acid amide hydrolase-like isoform X2 n=1 Tax=Ipomoea nil TaxID=35883 RepID=UPI000900A312|nr:PREDICTED: fatty acid amide hydrolase-like isoform X2 [Ipomoea nil]